MTCGTWEGLRSAFGAMKVWLASGAVLTVFAVLFVLGGRMGLYFVSTLIVEPLSSGASVNGIIYFLPKTTVVADITYKVLKCDLEKKNDTDGAPIDIVIMADVSASLAEKVEADPRNGYVIRSDSFSGTLWRTEVTIDVSNGLLKAVNATSTSEPRVSKEAELSTILTRVLSASRLTSETAAGDKSTLAERRIAVCGRALVQALDKPETGSSVTDQTKLRRLFHFDPSADCPSETEKVAAAPNAGSACRVDGSQMLEGLFADADAVRDALKRYSAEFRVVSGQSAPFGKPGGVGIVYRTPVGAVAQLCMPQCGTGARPIAEKSMVFPQLGPGSVLPVERRLFSDRTAQFDFGAYGELTKAKLIDASASAEKK
jgi:hypothetical protein